MKNALHVYYGTRARGFYDGKIVHLPFLQMYIIISRVLLFVTFNIVNMVVVVVVVVMATILLIDFVDNLNMS